MTTRFENGRIYTLEREGEWFSSMDVDENGIIHALRSPGAQEGGPCARKGGAEAPAGDADGNIRTVDLSGAAVVPGFVDSHLHLMPAVASASMGVVLSRPEGSRLVPDSLEGVGGLLREQAEGTGRGPVIGFGCCVGALRERRLPTGAELDAWVPGRPVIVFSLDGHSSAYSENAARILGIESMADNGVLTGEAHEFNLGKAISLIMKSLTPAHIARGFSAVMREAAGNGIVSLHCLEGFDDTRFDLSTFLVTRIGPRLPLALRLYLQYTDIGRVDRYARFVRNQRAGGCIAWEMDGSISSRSAAFYDNYLDRDHPGKLYRTPEEAEALIRPFADRGYQTAVHAIGPRAIESVLSAYEKILGKGSVYRGSIDGERKNGENGNRHRCRIEHFEFPLPDQVERAGALGIVTPVQPGFAWLDERFIHGYDEALSPAVRAMFTPLRSMAEAGCVISLSSDAPVQPLNPWLQIAGAVQHPVPSQRLSRYAALRAHTWGGAYAAGDEEIRGTRAVGKSADFAVLDADPFSVTEEELPEMKTRATYIGGRPAPMPPEDTAGFARYLLKHERKLM